MPSSPAQSDPPVTRWNFAAALAAWLLPGLGHWLLGQRKRALILAVTLGLLWTGGLAIGGISAIDRREHGFWFLGQMLLAPSLVVNLAHNRLRNAGRPLPHRHPAFSPGFAHAGEQGVLFTALAGLLNLLVMVDVLYRDPHPPEASRGVPPSETPGAPANGTDDVGGKAT